MPNLDSDLKDFFTIEGKVKIKTIQYSAIGIALVFTSWAWASTEVAH